MQSVQEELIMKNIEFIGLHYAGALNLSRGIDKELVEFQYKYLMEYDEWLTEQKALKLLKK